MSSSAPSIISPRQYHKCEAEEDKKTDRIAASKPGVEQDIDVHVLGLQNHDPQKAVMQQAVRW